MSWTVPGYAVERMLGVGGTGEVWAGREFATGECVALKRLRPGGTEREALRREALLLAAFRHPHVVRLRGVLSTADGLVLVLDLAEGGSFAGLLAAGEAHPAAEVGGLCAPVAQALAAAHAEGLVHGDVAPGNLLLDARGRPLLADLGTARLAGDDDAAAVGTPGYLDPAVQAGAVPSAASDVYGLAAVAVHLLTGKPPGGSTGTDAADPLYAALVLSLDPDPTRRPTATALAAVFERAARDGWARGEPMPVAARRAVLTGATTRAIPRPAPVVPDAGPWWRRAGTVADTGRCRGRHRRVSATVFVGAAAVVAVGILVPAAAAGLLTGRSGDERAPVGAASAAPTRAGAPGSPGPSAPGARPAPTDGRQAAALRTAVEALDRSRSVAFAQADVLALGRVYAPGSRGGAADAQALTSLRDAGVRAVGLRHEVVALRVVSTTSRVELLLTDRMPGYRLVDRRGTVLRSVAPRGLRTFRVQLVTIEGEWRIRAVSAT